MNIQIFGKTKCFETKKAQRWFKERGIKFQNIDMNEKGISKGELRSVLNTKITIDEITDTKAAGSEIVRYLSDNDAKFEKLLENPKVLKTPIVRNGKFATVGYMPDVWKNWE